MKPNSNETMTENMRELTDGEMAEIHAAGGDAVATADLLVVKTVDKASVTFVQACVNGK